MSKRERWKENRPFVLPIVYLFIATVLIGLGIYECIRDHAPIIHIPAEESSDISADENAYVPEFIGSMDLNTATKDDLMSVPGIGEVFAGRILAYRKELGKYTSVEQLLDISGIGEKRFAAWKDYFYIPPEE